MALINWIGNISDDINVAGNYATGSKPVSTDSVVLNKFTIRPMGTNLATFSGDTWPLLLIGEDCPLTEPFAVGASGKGLDVTITKLVNKSRFSGVITEGTVARAIIDSSKAKEKGPAYHSKAGACTTLVAVKGQSVIDNDSGITRLLVSFRNSRRFDADVLIDVAAPMTEMIQLGGVVRIVRGGAGASIFRVKGGQFIVEAAVTGTVTEMWIDEGRVKYDGQGTIAKVYGRTGELDTTGVSNLLTIDEMRRWPDFTFLKFDDIVTVTDDKDMTGGDR